ncbi:MAG: hypothetical protein HYW22_00065 [Candidatus Aenigmarchaeota archaeon]|nr:hypothetical protein [Candidatus Aenigmarchaeota archaeon]
MKINENGTLTADVYGPPESKPHNVSIDGPYMLSPYPNAPVKDVGHYTGSARTVVYQTVEGLFSKKPFESRYQAYPG